VLGQVLKELRKYLHIVLNKTDCFVRIQPHCALLSSVSWYLTDRKQSNHKMKTFQIKIHWPFHCYIFSTKQSTILNYINVSCSLYGS
jgi:hypothetical protein